MGVIGKQIIYAGWILYFIKCGSDMWQKISTLKIKENSWNLIPPAIINRIITAAQFCTWNQFTIVTNKKS